MLSSRGPKAEGSAVRLKSDPAWPDWASDFGVVLICLSTLAKKLSLLSQAHSQLRSFRMKGQPTSFSTGRGFVRAQTLSSRASSQSSIPELIFFPAFSALRLCGLCVGFVRSGSPLALPRGHTLDVRWKSRRMNTCTIIGEGGWVPLSTPPRVPGK